jgi:hypothetical protein
VAGKDNTSRRGRVGGAIVIVAAAVTVLAYFGIKPGSPSRKPPEPSPATTVVTRSSPSVGTMTAFLDGFQKSNASNAVSMGAVDVDGRKLQRGVSISALAGTAQSPNGVTFALPGDYTAVRAIVGVDTSSAAGFTGTIGVKVFAGEQVALTTQVSSGSPPCSINAPVSGANEVGLSAYFISGEPMTVAFGDARAVAGKDFADMPTAPACP